MVTVATFPAWNKWVGDPDYAHCGLLNLYKGIYSDCCTTKSTQLLVINSLFPLYSLAKCDEVRLDQCIEAKFD